MTNSILTKEQKAALAKSAERRKLVDDCCKVDSPGLLDFFDEDIFKYDNWVVSDAMNFLAGVKLFRTIIASPFIEVITLNGENYFSSEDPDITNRFEKEVESLWSIWKSGHHENQNPPKYYIDWALSKNIKIHWLDYATEKGLLVTKEPDFIPPHNANALDKPLNTRTENNYLRLILTLAIGGIKGFDPKKPYEAAKLIIDETDISIGQDTIAGYISKAYELESKSRD